MEKELALAFDFDDAPKGFKELAKEHRANFKRWKKAEAQFEMWNNEREEARRLHSISKRKFAAALEEWPVSKEVKEELKVELAK